MLSYAESDVDLVFSFICFIFQIKLHGGFKSCCSYVYIHNAGLLYKRHIRKTVKYNLLLHLFQIDSKIIIKLQI